MAWFPWRMSAARRRDRARLGEIEWARFETAYGSARKVPRLLLDFVHGDLRRAQRAGHELWCSLCHQHAYASSAALPALPWIVAALERPEVEVVAEAIDMLVGFARCTDPAIADAPDWHRELRAGVQDAASAVARVAGRHSAEVQELARDLRTELGLGPEA